MEEEILARGVHALLLARQITTPEAVTIAALLEPFDRPESADSVGLIRAFLLEDPPQLDEVVAQVDEWVSRFWSTEEELAGANDRQQASDEFDAVRGLPPRGPDDPPPPFPEPT